MDVGFALVFHIQDCPEIVTKGNLIAFWRKNSAEILSWMEENFNPGLFDRDLVIEYKRGVGFSYWIHEV